MSLSTERSINFASDNKVPGSMTRRDALLGGAAALLGTLACNVFGQEISIKPEEGAPITPEQETQKALALLHLLESQGVTFNMDGTVVTDNKTNKSYTFDRVVVDDDTCAIYPIYFGPCGPSQPNQPTSVPGQPTPQTPPENPGNPNEPDKSPAGDQVEPDGETDPNSRGEGQEGGDANGTH